MNKGKKHIKWTLEVFRKFVLENSDSTLVSGFYNTQKTKLEFRCGCESIYITTPSSFIHANKRTCNKCSGKTRSQKQSLSLSQVKDFVENESDSGCKLISDEYVNAGSKLSIRCKCNKIFETTIGNFKSRNKRQCNNCGDIIRANKRRTPYDDIRRYIESSSNCTLISKNYINDSSTIQLRCGCGEEFTTKFNNFKFGNKRQCNKCGGELISNNKTISYDDRKRFIEDSHKSMSGLKLLSSPEDVDGGESVVNISDKEGYQYGFVYNTLKSILTEGSDMARFHKANPFTIHNIHLWMNKSERSHYKLTSESYDGCDEYLDFICPHGNKIKMSWNSFRRGVRCLCTKESLGEEHIRKNLDKNNYSFLQEYTFDDLRGSSNRLFRFDFAILNKSGGVELLVEFDGEGHYYPVEFGGMSASDAKKSFDTTKLHDKMKNEYSKDNGIPLLRIPYWELDNIGYILNEELK